MTTEAVAAISPTGARAADRSTAPDFRALDRSKAYTKDCFFKILVDVHKSGRRMRWSMTEPRVEPDVNLAIHSYVYMGSITVRDGKPGGRNAPRRRRRDAGRPARHAVLRAGLARHAVIHTKRKPGARVSWMLRHGDAATIKWKR